jgi:hypothetical protein
MSPRVRQRDEVERIRAWNFDKLRASFNPSTPASLRPPWRTSPGFADAGFPRVLLFYREIGKMKFDYSLRLGDTYGWVARTCFVF